MKTVSAGLLAHLAAGSHTLAQCLKMTCADTTVIAVTTHDENIVFDGVTYLAASGATASDIESRAALSVQNAEARGFLNLDTITETDLRAGKYDYAAISIFTVNWSNLAQGAYSQIDGWIGEVTTERATFVAELRGLTQALSRTIGHLCAPLCHARLGDAECKVDLNGFGGLDSPSSAFTVSGTLTGVNADNLTLFDAARTEPGPSGAIAITGVTNANPGVVTTASVIPVANGGAVVISDVGGMTPINGTTIVRNKSGSTFELGVDTSDTGVYPAYTGGGYVWPVGSEAGWFDYGIFTATSGLCSGLSMEVKAYVPGQWTLQLPMPYDLAVGDSYTMVAGCNKTITTCNTKFANHLNFRGRPYVPGQDKILQIGRHST